MKRLSEHVFAETEFQWANVGGAVTDDGVVLIDCPVRPTDSQRWQSDVRPLSPLGIRYLISTDFHGDHATGSSFVEGVTFIAPQIVYEKIAGNYAFSKKSFIETLRDQGHTEEAARIAEAVIPLPKICFEDSLILHLPPLTFEIRRMGGHTPACSVVYIPEEKVIFTSDVLMDNPNPGMREANVGQWLKALDWIEGLPVDHIVPGHGEIGGKEIIPKLKRYLLGIRETMQKQVQAGKAKEEAIADSSFDKFLSVDQSQGSYWAQYRKDNFRLGLASLYDEVKGEQGT